MEIIKLTNDDELYQAGLALARSRAPVKAKLIAVEALLQIADEEKRKERKNERFNKQSGCD